MTDKVRVGLLGCGNVGAVAHVLALRDLPAVREVASVIRVEEGEA
jgi:predicted dehydrogenase